MTTRTPATIRQEARSALAGYVSTHPDLEPDLLLETAWRQAARTELAARSLGVVKALSDDVLHAIVAGTLDMPALYSSARDGAAKVR